MNTAVAEDLHEWLSFEDPDEDRTWIFDVTFLMSPYTCIYGRGCQGVLTGPAPEMEQGCCSYGAHFTDDDDQRRVEKFAAKLTAKQWQFKSVADRRGYIASEPGGTTRTRLHQGACIFLNRPGFPGGAGCALHRAALEKGRSPMKFKPDVCWQLPLRRVDSTDEVGHVTSTVREWKRRDWGEGGAEFHWWCTESPEAFVAHEPVYTGMRDELIGLVGRAVYDQFVAAMEERPSRTNLPHPTLRIGRDR